MSHEASRGMGRVKDLLPGVSGDLSQSERVGNSLCPTARSHCASEFRDMPVSFAM